MDISIISHHLGLQGSNMNLLDLNQNLLDINKRVLFYTNDYTDLYQTIQNSKRIYDFYDLRELNYRCEISETPIVFTDFKTLIKIFSLNITIKCFKLFVFDNNELSYHLFNDKSAKFFYENININRLIKPHYFNEVTFLMPSCDIDIFKKKYPDIPCEIYYKQINYNILKKIDYKTTINKLCFRSDDIDISDKIISKFPSAEVINNFDIWDYKGLIYYRRKHLNYWEQYGRLIFEFILLNKEVYFLNNPFEVNDGLSDYLKYFDIKFENNKVVTTSNELIPKMKFKYNF